MRMTCRVAGKSAAPRRRSAGESAALCMTCRAESRQNHLPRGSCCRPVFRLGRGVGPCVVDLGRLNTLLPCAAPWHSLSRQFVSAAKPNLTTNPLHNQADGLTLQIGGQLYAQWNTPPLVHTTTATSRRGVLGDEDGVPMHGRLPSVFQGMCRRKFLPDEVLGMAADGVKPLLLKVVPLTLR